MWSVPVGRKDKLSALYSQLSDLSGTRGELQTQMICRYNRRNLFRSTLQLSTGVEIEERNKVRHRNMSQVTT